MSGKHMFARTISYYTGDKLMCEYQAATGRGSVIKCIACGIIDDRKNKCQVKNNRRFGKI